MKMFPLWCSDVKSSCTTFLFPRGLDKISCAFNAVTPRERLNLFHVRSLQRKPVTIVFVSKMKSVS